MTILFKRRLYREELNADGGEGPAAAAAPEEPKEVAVEDMAAHIREGLDKLAPKEVVKDDAKPEPVAKPDAKPEGDVKSEAKPDAKPEEKTGPSLELSEEEKRVLSRQAQERFHELAGAVKAKDAEIAEVRAVYQKTAEARDAFVNVLRDTQTTGEDLTALLEFNRNLKTGNLESALEFVEFARQRILKDLGREAPGVDLLADHPDLKAKVDALDLSREDALELVKARNLKSGLQRQTEEQTAANGEMQRREAASNEIEKWEERMRASDIDFKAKSAKILAKLPDIMKKYPPAQWLPTIELMYDSIVVPAAPRREAVETPQPLRPRGSGGAKPEAADMLSAMKIGLGYST